ncbi:MAG: hypothetical protein SFU85_07950 [Candidatus Methylacidiphilales bacterium]|nr:hypothetical protein [Candidatus Methylacidiphilales bacterium]
MNELRPRLLALAAVLSLVFAIGWFFFFRESGINANFKKERLDKVMAYLEKKTGLDLETSFDPSTPVTLFLHQAGVGEALDSLALAVDGRCVLFGLVAPSEQEINDFVAGLVSGKPLENWTQQRLNLPGFLLAGVSNTLTDPRQDPLAVPDQWPTGGLQTHLKTLAESSDLTWAAPTPWDPVVTFNPGKIKVGQAIPALARAAKGQGRLVVFLRDGRRGGGARPEGLPGGEGPTPGEGSFRGAREMPDPAVVNRRVEARIAALPQQEQAEARAAWQRDREMWEQLRQLPPEQRREKMREWMDNPAAQERMENNQADRDARRSPEKRHERYRNYLNRKAQVKS